MTFTYLISNLKPKLNKNVNNFDIEIFFSYDFILPVVNLFDASLGQQRGVVFRIFWGWFFATISIAVRKAFRQKEKLLCFHLQLREREKLVVNAPVDTPKRNYFNLNELHDLYTSIILFLHYIIHCLLKHDTEPTFYRKIFSVSASRLIETIENVHCNISGDTIAKIYRKKKRFGAKTFIVSIPSFVTESR